MNMLLTLSLLLVTLIVMAGIVFLARKRRISMKRQASHRPLRRFQRQHIPGITPLILRASRPRRTVHPPVIQVLPQAVAPSPTPEEQLARQKQVASQTTIYDLAVSRPLKLSSCPHCAKQNSAHDLFCGSCGMRLHRSAQVHE